MESLLPSRWAPSRKLGLLLSAVGKYAMPKGLRRTLHLIGGSIALLSLMFVSLKLVQYSDRMDFGRLNFQVVSVLLLVAFAYGGASLLLGLAWRDLLLHFGVLTTVRWAIWAHGVSQLAKYVPGNIFHFAGRQVLGAAAELPAWPLVKSAAWELGLLGGTGALFVTLLLPLAIGEGASAFWGMSAGVSFFAAALIFVCGAARLFSPAVGRAVIRYQVFLTIAGLSFIATLQLISQGQSFDSFMFFGILGAYVVAWLVGLVTPGAPAGVGVRETVLFGLLEPYLGAGDILAAVVVGRLITVVGDLTYFCAALALGYRHTHTWLRT